MIETENLEQFIQSASAKELRELIEITEAWASKYDSKFYLYEPNDIPKMFHMSNAKIRALFGGNRSGKTQAHIQDFVMQFLGSAPKCLEGVVPQHRLNKRRKLRFCMEDYPNSFVKTVYPYFQSLIPEDEICDVVKDSGRVRAITNHSGGFIEFMYYDQETSKHAGSSRDAIGYDEEPPEAIREQGLLRLVDTDGEETFSLTPESGATHYLYDDIYLKRGREVEKNYDIHFNDKGKIIGFSKGEIRDIIIPGGDKDTHVFFACIFDNRAINESSAIRILSKFTKEEVMTRAKGHFMFKGGLVYKHYNDAVHLIEPFTDWYEKPTSDYYSLMVAIDPHPRTPHAVLFVVVRKDGMMYVVDEIYKDCDAIELVKLIKEKCRGKTPELILVDPIASTPDPSTKSSFLVDLINYGLRNPIPIPASKDKDRGIISVNRRMAVNDRGLAGLYVTSNCQRFRYEITRYAWDEWRVDVNNSKGVKQKPIDKDDHMMENLYRIELAYCDWKEEYDKYDDFVDFLNEDYTIERGRNATTGY